MTTASSAPLRRGFFTQARVIKSLMLREVGTRYGRENIGFLWFVGEPMMLATVITLLHKLYKQTHYEGGISPIPFTILGYTIFIIFRNIFNKAEGAIESSKPLFYHRMVSVFDVLLSRAMVDVAGTVLTTTILLTIAVQLDAAPLPVRPLHLFAAIALMVWFTLGVTMIASAATYRSEMWGRQLHVISYFSIPISGAFWQFSWLPTEVANVLQWFPMPLIFEEARYGLFVEAPSEYVSPGYVSAWCAGLFYTGLLLTRRRRRTMHA